MPEWLLRLLNISGEFAGHSGDASVAFQNPRTLGVGLVLLVPVAVYIYLRQLRNLPTVPAVYRIALSLSRVLILLLLVLILGGPILRLDHRGENKPVVAFLFDQSRSMRLPAGVYDERESARVAAAAGYAADDPDARRALARMGRAKLVRDVVQKGTGKPVLDALAKKYDLRFYAFDRDVSRLGLDAAHPELPEPTDAGGPATCMGDAIARVLDDAAGRQVAGVLLFSDGQNTAGRSPGEAARAAAGAGVPVFTVPPGSPRRLSDVAITDVFATGLVSVGDTARVAVTLEASPDFERRPTKVELLDGDRVLDSKELILRGTEQMQVDLTFKPTEAGVRHLTVRVPPQPEESEELRGNNTDTAVVRVTDEKLKVLYVEGPPRWDYRFLRNAMRRDNGLAGRGGHEPDFVLENEWRRRPPAERVTALPGTLERLAEYHVVVLGDASPSLLDATFLENLDKAVRERGVGLIVQAGPLAMPHRFGDRLDALLPVRLRPGVPGQQPRGTPSFRIEPAPEGTLHEAMRLYDDPGRNQNAWAQMPPFFWSAAAERPAPGASVLAYNSVPTAYGKMPLIAQHYAGKGKVLFVGTDSTWLWRQNVGDRFFYKFWGQAIRAVARTDATKAKKSSIDVRPARVQPGDPAEIELNAFSPDGSPRTEERLSVQVRGGGGAVVELSADPEAKGRYRGRFTPPAEGDYRLTFNPGGSGAAVETRLRVAAAPEEMRQPNINRPALEQIAAASAGGTLVELPDLKAVPDRLAGESKFTELHRETSLWDNGLILGILIFLYSADVGIRRLLGLS
jgi:hypothetical protein